MIYRKFKDKSISLLGFGAMRLPCKEDKSIDEEKVEEMVDIAIKSGVNYFDTAYPYHSGLSEIVMGKILSKYPRESYYLATKFPGHQIADEYNPKSIFEEQLKKCGVEYFDFYLLHNVYENSIGVYMDDRWGILEYFLEQKKNGRIKHLGFSSHGGTDNIREFLEYCGDKMEFCQIQLNYLDWTLQSAKEKCEILDSYNIPVWVMEPVRGGKLASLSEENEKTLCSLRPDKSIASWAFRWLQNHEDVKVILSGMSNINQMKDNISTFDKLDLLSEEEEQILLDIAERMKNSLPCTSCRYCIDGCPKGLEIPKLISIYNEIRVPSASLTAAMRMEAFPDDKLPSACIGCGKCSAICPQKIDIPKAMEDFSNRLNDMPKWSDICRERNEAAQKLKESAK